MIIYKERIVVGKHCGPVERALAWDSGNWGGLFLALPLTYSVSRSLPTL